jgi:hypothetical protein
LGPGPLSYKKIIYRAAVSQTSLKDELIYKGAAKQDQPQNNVLEVHPKITAMQCDNCSQLNNQLEISLNELSSVKLITEILNEEIKTLKHTTHLYEHVED